MGGGRGVVFFFFFFLILLFSPFVLRGLGPSGFHIYIYVEQKLVCEFCVNKASISV